MHLPNQYVLPAVRPQLDTPLIQRVDFKEVTALAAVLDASAEREEKVSGRHGIRVCDAL